MERIRQRRDCLSSVVLLEQASVSPWIQGVYEKLMTTEQGNDDARFFSSSFLERPFQLSKPFIRGFTVRRQGHVDSDASPASDQWLVSKPA
ncbi:hypothetical protein HYQ44_006059 [Verticillium longisporum]|nr:hypothetical protein HYQ44_006059 [Verticillium longisporum]